jgi:hypothetical protein
VDRRRHPGVRGGQQRHTRARPDQLTNTRRAVRLELHARLEAGGDRGGEQDRVQAAAGSQAHERLVAQLIQGHRRAAR